MKSFLLAILILMNSIFLPVGAQDLLGQELSVKEVKYPFSVADSFSYNFQKYTAFNSLVKLLAKSFIKSYLKLKTRAKDIKVELEIFSGWDLIRKKTKSLNISANNLFVSNIPLEYFSLKTKDPICFGKKNRVMFPLGVNARLEASVNNIAEVLNNLPKWKSVFQELEVPLPPFGKAKISLADFKIKLNEDGFLEFSSSAMSLSDPESEPLKINFSGNIVLSNKKIIIRNLQSEMEDIFTEDSEISKSFSKFLEELINPIFDFHKYEKKGLTIDSVNLTFGKERLFLDIDFKLMPKSKKNQ